MSFEQPHHAYILRQRPYQNTSQIIDLFSKEAGRISVVAKGLGTRKSAWAGILRPFSCLSIHYQGKSELKTLTEVEPIGAVHTLSGLGLYCGFYANELLLYTLHKEDPHPDTFAAYQTLLNALACKDFSSIKLRQFEYQLLCELGFGFEIQQDKTGAAIKPNSRYIFHQGLAVTDKISGVAGHCLGYLADGDTTDAHCLQSLKKMMRSHIDSLLEGRKLKSRDLLQDFLRVSREPKED